MDLLERQGRNKGPHIPRRSLEVPLLLLHREVKFFLCALQELWALQVYWCLTHSGWQISQAMPLQGPRFGENETKQISWATQLLRDWVQIFLTRTGADAARFVHWLWYVECQVQKFRFDSLAAGSWHGLLNGSTEEGGIRKTELVVVWEWIEGRASGKTKFQATQRLLSLTPRSSLRGARDNAALKCILFIWHPHHAHYTSKLPWKPPER